MKGDGSAEMRRYIMWQFTPVLLQVQDKFSGGSEPVWLFHTIHVCLCCNSCVELEMGWSASRLTLNGQSPRIDFERLVSFKILED